MIPILILNLLNWILVALFWPIPKIPPMSPDIVAQLNTAKDFIVGAISFINHIYGEPLAGIIFGMTLSLLFFNQGYYIVMWILRRLHIVG